jgi:hypothetical protein
MTRRFGLSAAVLLAAASLSSVFIYAVQAQTTGAAQSAATPRLSDGKPDLSGIWGNVGGGGGGAADKPDESGNLTVLTKGRPCHPSQAQCEPGINFERDAGVRQRMMANLPLYKPEFWEKVQYLDQHGNAEDPEFKCRPAGVPRMGPPNKIVQTLNELVFLYQNHNTFRVIRYGEHDPIYSVDQTWMGDPVARWDGDTLVIDSIGFTDESWLGWPGWFHSNNMHVIERMRRDGNTLTWQATVDDPDVLIKPWITDTRTLRLNPNPTAFLIEDLPCEERDFEHIVTKERG